MGAEFKRHGGGGRIGARQDPRSTDEREAMNVRWRKPLLTWARAQAREAGISLSAWLHRTLEIEMRRVIAARQKGRGGEENLAEPAKSGDTLEAKTGT